MNEKMKNKIISLSGEPVSGKGTTTKTLISILRKEGYSEENIHVVSTGDEFRRYFKMAIDFIENLKLNNKEEYTHLAKTPELIEIMSNDEYNEAFRKTAFQLLKNDIDTSKMSIGEMNNLEELKDIRKALDSLLDGRMRKLGEKINKTSRPDEVWILDSRLAFNNVPSSFAVRLTTDKNIAGKRLFEDQQRGKEDKYKSVEEAIKVREERKNGERERYLKRYGIDLEETSNYDLIVDTSYCNPEDTANTILQCLQYEIEGKEYSKQWTSPKVLLPLQSERDTLSTALYSLDEMYEKIKKEGFFPDSPIEVVESNGYKGIVEGHHRNFAAAMLGKTLIPYKVIGKDDEHIIYNGGTPRERINSISLNNLYGHEQFIEFGEQKTKGENVRFSYNDVYPNIYEKIRNSEKLSEKSYHDDYDDPGDR